MANADKSPETQTATTTTPLATVASTPPAPSQPGDYAKALEARMAAAKPVRDATTPAPKAAKARAWHDKARVRRNEAGDFVMDPADIIVIGLDTEDGPEHPLYDERISLKLTPEKLYEFYRDGPHTPVIVTLNPDNASEVLLVAGRQRVRLTRAANAKRKSDGLSPWPIKVTHETGDDLTHFRTLVSENEARTDDNLVQKAGKLARLMGLIKDANPDWPAARLEAEAARPFAVSPSTVRNWLKIPFLPKSVRHDLANGALGLREALELAKSPAAEQEAKAGAVKAKKAGKQAAKAAHREAKKAGKPAPAAPVEVRAPKKTLVQAVANALGGSKAAGAVKLALFWAVGEVGEDAAREDPILAAAIKAAKKKLAGA